MKEVSVFADASFDKESGIAGYAVVITTRNELFKFGGVLNNDVRDSSHAEALALFTGISIAAKMTEEYTRITAYSDSIHALNVFQIHKRIREERQFEIALRKDVQNILKKHKLMFSVRHVKGHQTGTNLSKEALINTWCHKQAQANSSSAIISQISI